MNMKLHWIKVNVQMFEKRKHKPTAWLHEVNYWLLRAWHQQNKRQTNTDNNIIIIIIIIIIIAFSLILLFSAFNTGCI